MVAEFEIVHFENYPAFDCEEFNAKDGVDIALAVVKLRSKPSKE